MLQRKAAGGVAQNRGGFGAGAAPDVRSFPVTGLGLGCAFGLYKMLMGGHAKSF